MMNNKRKQICIAKKWTYIGNDCS